LIDVGETEPDFPSLRVSVEPERRDKERLRGVSTGLALDGETFPRSDEVDMIPKAGTLAEASIREAEETEGAFPKILRAEETGDLVSDLYEALC
jgi:hypothetical protein